MILQDCFKILGRGDLMKTLTLGKHAVYGRTQKGLHIIALKRNDSFMDLRIDSAPSGMFHLMIHLRQRIEDESIARFGASE